MRRIGLFSGIVMGTLTLAIPLAAVASPITGLNVFSNGTTADANEVNANFDAVETAVNDNAGSLNALQTVVNGIDRATPSDPMPGQLISYCIWSHAS